MFQFPSVGQKNAAEGQQVVFGSNRADLVVFRRFDRATMASN
jgi:hypothetical protein